MTPREKKLSIAVLVVAAFALLDFAYSMLTKDESNGVAQTEVERTKVALAQVNAQLLAHASSRDDVHTLKLANTPYSKDAVSLPDKGEMATQNGEQLPFLTCSGFMLVGADYVAIINGQEYRVGEQVADTNEFVMAIDSRGVKLRLQATGAERHLSYSDGTAEH